MGRYGVQISQQGIDVTRAADYQKVLDSNWKFLDISLDIPIDKTITISGTGIRLFEIASHALGYVPGFEFMPSALSISPVYTDYAGVHEFIKADNQKVYAEISFPGTYRIVGRLRVFTLNIMDEYAAPSLGNNSLSPAASSRYGAKFLDLNKGMGDIDDEDMIPFTLNTRGKQMSIHKHGTQVANEVNGTLNIRHDVGYPPTYLICRVIEKSTVTYVWPYTVERVSGGLVSSFFSAKADPTNIEFRGAQSGLFGRYGYVILKDPAEIAG